ncbi:MULTISPECIES: helix-turn-helix domain-containing protein [Kitasatospora]|uniref:Helix-turn-helix transcriptional regulator n=1 Tax=Kitasatospora cathayae TaxID=3004092 RepID=A0ABY7Q552_9ACTN|nr:helix-turn-helix transcriptional regulator [Kitasatospora sp. HUAS 3-15]WBP87788.1 helix-turn-helix transcriptional regulator [Kitasatospora sp. HUAS 3-15]
MALRSNPTLRQLRLGAELRRMREQAGLGGSQLARALGINPAHVTQMESGKTGISVERLRTIAALCMCVNEPLIEALAEIITDRDKGGWWEEYRGRLSQDFLEVAEIERHARGLSAYTMAFIHGLLQTNGYASAVFARSYPPLPGHEVDLRASFRLRRQHIIRSEATPFTAYIHEAALRMQFGGAKIHAEQLGALVDASEQPNISIRVVLFDADTIPLPNENFTYFEGPVQELDTVQADSGVGNLIFDAPANTARFRSLITRIGSAALSEQESREFIRSIKKDMESKYA